jgi:hypothetical protein
MESRSKKVEKLTRDILDLINKPPEKPAAYLQCPNCSHRIGLIVSESDGTRVAAPRKPAASAKKRKPQTISPALRMVRKLASKQKVVTGKVFKAMRIAIGDVSGLSKPEIRKRQVAWLKVQLKSSGRSGKGRRKAA